MQYPSMSRFLQHSIIFIGLIGILLIILRILLPYYYGNELFRNKLADFRSTQSKYNGVVFGSSRLYHGLDPELLGHSLTHDAYKFYNFGIEGCINPESYYLYENFVNGLDSGAIQLAILELTHVDSTFRNNQSSRRNYWLRFSDYSNISNRYKDEYNTYEVLQKMVNLHYQKLSSLPPIFHYYSNQDDPTDHKIGKGGYYPFEQMIQHKRNGKSEIEQKYYSFLSDTSKIIPIIRQASLFPQLAELDEFNNFHYDRLLELIHISTNKGIKLFFLLSPRGGLGNDYSKLIPVANQLDSSLVINLANFRKYPELYLTKNAYEIEHLNQAGAEILTAKLAREMNE